MSTPEQRAAWAKAQRERWRSMSPEKKARRLAQQREYARQRRVPTGRKPGNVKGSRRVSVNKNERYQFILQMKFERGECLDCGLEVDDWNHAAMEWDHRVPAEKSFTLSSVWKRSVSYEVIRAETDKCDLVCANCHRIRTYWGRDHDHRNEPPAVQPDTKQLGLFDGI